MILSVYKNLKYLGVDPEVVFGDEYSKYKELNLKQSIDEIVCFFEILISKSFEALKTVKKSTNSKLMEIVKEYIISNYNTEISLDALSDLVHLTPTYVSKLFKLELYQNESYIDEFLMDAMHLVLFPLNGREPALPGGPLFMPRKVFTETEPFKETLLLISFTKSTIKLVLMF